MRTKIKYFFGVYVLLWVITFFVISILLSRGERSFANSATLFFEFATGQRFLIGFHVIFILCYLLFLAAKYFIRIYRSEGKQTLLKKFALHFALPVLLIFVGYKTLAYSNTNEWYSYEWDTNVMNESGIAVSYTHLTLPTTPYV